MTAATMKGPERATGTVYIVEDDVAVRDALRLYLGSVGRAVVAHGDAEGFLAEPYPGADDMVVIDLNLPGIGGADVLRLLAAQAERPWLIAMSGMSLRRIKRELAGSSVDQVLRKPLEIDELERTFAPGLQSDN